MGYISKKGTIDIHMYSKTLVAQNVQPCPRSFSKLFIAEATVGNDSARQRYKCLQLTKSDNEDFKEYGSKVNLQCELFKLYEMQIDQFKCLIFVLGLKSSKDNDICIRLVDDNKD